MNRETDRYRRNYGCRRLDRGAISSYPIKMLDMSIDHCPGVHIDTPWMISLIELDRAISVGFGLPEYRIAYSHIVDSLLDLKEARARLKGELKNA